MRRSILDPICSCFLARLIKGAFLLACILPLPASAHPADVTPLRILVERQQLELRFTFSLFTLARMMPLDKDQDHFLAPAELNAVKPALTQFLQKHVLIRINDHPTGLGTIARWEPLWPGSEPVDLRTADRSVDVFFTLPSAEVIANAWMEFTFFPQLGELASVQASYEQGTLVMQVPFTPHQPDYSYDTGFAVEDLFQKPAPASPPPTHSFWRLNLVNILIFVFIGGMVGLIFRKPRKGAPASTP
ncbi:hypothetical protein EI77_02840 [Prosthecobacter fusiformis]|uniref:Uncharacterized protein n=1 Tax=Prosthecobacter fusiformis TaxID=48464 RepID=A0A4R7RY74_9BACT|nr:hypothetical protein [Prosthecobacter fusiformis]TDU70791.1 hypothetical protein EI77_02840 [Prosthecobacter fusiformis]